MTKKNQIFHPSVKQLDATNKTYLLRREMNDNELSSLLNISKVTLYTRLKRSNWTNPEILFIEYRSNLSFKKTVDSLNIIDP